MNIMIFAAGMGTRLKPLTDIIPKALVPVAGKPLLQHVLERVDAEGNTIVINIHHHAEQIRNFIDITRHHWRSNILLSDESTQLLETGGGIKHARPLFCDWSQNSLPEKPGEGILIHNVDILSNVNLTDFYAQSKGNDATLLVSTRKTQRYLLFDNDMRLVGWTNISTREVRSPYPEIAALNGTDLSTHSLPYGGVGGGSLTLYAFSGIHCLSPAMFPLMDQWPDRFPIMDFYLRHCADFNIRGIVKDDLRLLDVGKLDTLESSTDFINSL